jgi:hypothetical protein
MDIIKDIEGVAQAGMDIRTRLIIVLAVVLALGALAAYGANHFEAKGRALERADWLAKQVREQQADAALVARHDADMRAIEDKHQQIERTTSEKHEQELAQLRRERDADRRRADAAGGLRIPAPACPAGSTVAGTEAASAGGRDAAGPGTVRLPQQVENDLWVIADDADEVSAQLRACQGWILANGFYGPQNSAWHELLGRIDAIGNQDSRGEAQ